MARIIVSGSLAYDRIMDFAGKFSDHIMPEKIHNLNLSFPVGEIQEQFGGTAGNIAYSLRLLGDDPLIVATAGKDFSPYLEHIQRQGISPECIVMVENVKTASAHIMTDQADNQITAFYLGAMAEPAAKKLLPEHVDIAALAIVSAGNISDMDNLCKKYQDHRQKYIFDPGQALPVLTPEVLVRALSGAWLMIANDYEMELVRNKTGLSQAELLKRCPHILTTLGEKGSRLETPEGVTEIASAKAKEVIDPTGAGDAFRAGLMHGVTRGLSLFESAQLGSVTAVYTVEKAGTQTHAYTLEEVKARFFENYKKSITL